MDFKAKKFVLKVNFNQEVQLRISLNYSVFTVVFPWEILKRNCKKVLVNSGLFLLIIMPSCSCGKHICQFPRKKR